MIDEYIAVWVIFFLIGTLMGAVFLTISDCELPGGYFKGTLLIAAVFATIAAVAL